MSPIDHFIETYKSHPKILKRLEELGLDSEGRFRTLNRTTLAELAGVQYTVVHRTEMCLYERIPPTLLHFMKSHSSPYEDYPQMYRNDCRLTLDKHIFEEERKSHASGKHWLVELPSESRVPVGSFKEWRTRHFDSVMDMAKLLMVNPTIIMNWESGKTKNFPEPIHRKFNLFHMDKEVLHEVEKLSRPVWDKLELSEV